VANKWQRVSDLWAVLRPFNDQSQRRLPEADDTQKKIQDNRG